MERFPGLRQQELWCPVPEDKQDGRDHYQRPKSRRMVPSVSTSCAPRTASSTATGASIADLCGRGRQDALGPHLRNAALQQRLASAPVYSVSRSSSCGAIIVSLRFRPGRRSAAAAHCLPAAHRAARHLEDALARRIVEQLREGAAGLEDPLRGAELGPRRADRRPLGAPCQLDWLALYQSAPPSTSLDRPPRRRASP